MELKTITDLATLASTLSAFVAILVGIRTYRRQNNADVFLHYTERYDTIIARFPASFRLRGELPDVSEDLQLICLSYLNLCSEEYYLRQRRYLASDVWRIWEAEVLHTLATPLFVREWKVLRGQFASYRAFSMFVDQAQPAGGVASSATSAVGS